MTGPTEPGLPRRVVVTSPRMRARRRTSGYGVTQDIDTQTRLGEVFMASLIRSQLRLAIFTCAALILAVAVLPLVFSLAPDSWLGAGQWLPWGVLGIGVYPCLLAGGWWYVRQAERNEREFVELVDRS